MRKWDDDCFHEITTPPSIHTHLTFLDGFFFFSFLLLLTRYFRSRGMEFAGRLKKKKKKDQRKNIRDHAKQ
jgi:hypothetical protein